MLNKEELDTIESYDALCSIKCKLNPITKELECPRINGVELEESDFGEKYDTSPETAEPYGCGNMQFIPFEEVKQETLEKYNLTELEYRVIQKKLDCLSFGSCGLCV